MILIGGLLWWAVARRRTWPVVSFGLVWFFLNLVIESTIIPLELLFEHRMYLPSMGFFMSVVALATTGFSKLTARKTSEAFHSICWCVILLAASGLTLATFYRNETWGDMITFTRDQVQKAPLSPRAHANLAYALARRGKEYPEAVQEGREAIRLGEKNHDEYAAASNTIVISYVEMGEYATAVSEGWKLIEGKKWTTNSYAMPAICFNIANACERMEDYYGALLALREAVIRNQRLTLKNPLLEVKCMVQVHRIIAMAGERGMDLLGDGRPGLGDRSAALWVADWILDAGGRETAIQVLDFAHEADPSDEGVCELLERFASEDWRSAKQEAGWDFSCKYIEHPWSRFNVSMGIAHLIQSRKPLNRFRSTGEALADYALGLVPDSPDAELLKGWYRYDAGELDEAVSWTRRAVALDGDYARGWFALGFFLAMEQRKDEAAYAFNRGLYLYPKYPQRRVVLDLLAELNGNADRRDGLSKQDGENPGK